MRKPYQVRDASMTTTGQSACVHCGRPAAKEILQKQAGIVIIEKYCDICSEPTTFKRLQEWYSKAGLETKARPEFH